MNFHQSFSKCRILTPDIRKQPQRETLYGKIFGGIPKKLVLCNFLQILVVSDKNGSQGF